MKLQADSVSWTADASGMRLTLRTPRAREIAESLPDKTWSVEIKEYRKKRSLNANGYYWLLLGKLAEALHFSTPYTHNLMLRRYGQYERYDDMPVYVMLPDTEEAQKKADEADTYHLSPTSHTKLGKDKETVFRSWMLLRGSSTYDSKEMARLIDGLVDECRQVGIETMTPAELARLEGYDRG